MRVGDILISGIPDGFGLDRARDLLSKPGHDGDAWKNRENLLDDDGYLVLTYGGYLVRTKDRTILVDLGVGPQRTDRYAGGAFLTHLRSVGVSPEMVTDVLFTHLHFDHIGWSSVNGSVVFPNATFRLHPDDWDYFVKSKMSQSSAIEKLTPIEDRVLPFADAETLLPGIRARHVPGHTPGSTIFEVYDGRERALLVGDVVHTAMEFTDDGWVCAFDVDPESAASVKRDLGRELLTTSDYAALAHAPDLSFGTVVAGVKGPKWHWQTS